MPQNMTGISKIDIFPRVWRRRRWRRRTEILVSICRVQGMPKIWFHRRCKSIRCTRIAYLINFRQEFTKNQLYIGKVLFFGPSLLQLTCKNVKREDNIASKAILFVWCESHCSTNELIKIDVHIYKSSIRCCWLPNILRTHILLL